MLATLEGISDEHRGAQGRLIMTGQNHYEVLGVPHDADQAQLRAAYVSLLKRHHPDKASANEAQENAAEVQRIVGAYRALKDPRARAAYDASLQAATSRAMAPASPRFRPPPPPSPRPRFRPPPPARARFRPRPPRTRKVRRATRSFRLDTDTLSYVIMLVVAAVGLQLLVSRLLVLRVPHSARTLLAGAAPPGEIPIHPQLERTVRNAAMISAAEASNYSARCFAAARRSRKAVAADPCVGFDMAYVYWRETAGGPLVTDPYFQPDTVSERARDAFSGLNPIGAAARVQSVRAATLRAIAETPNGPDEFALAFSVGEAGLKSLPAGRTSAEAPPRKD